MERIEKLKYKLALVKHPEGGFYAENYRSAQQIGNRSLATSIHFLLTEGDRSHFHVIQSDELWYFHEGAPCIIHAFDLDGRYIKFDLGLDIDRGQQPMIKIPAGYIFGSESSGDYSLVSCMVAPGFDFQDFKLFTTSELLQRIEGEDELIRKFTKDNYS